jgi:hypothetical protein
MDRDPSDDLATKPTELTGGCMCGAVRFELSAPLRGAAYCHCTRCQRRTGTSPSVSGLTQPGSLALTHGRDVVRSYRPGGDGWLKSFCPQCGSQLFATSPENPDLVAVRLGAIDQDPGVRPGVHQFVDYAPPWAPVPDDGLPRFPQRIPADKLR